MAVLLGVLLTSVASAVPVAPAGAGAMNPQPPELTVISTRPGMVTGDTVLVAAPANATFRLDGTRAEARLVRSGQWLVGGLEPGRHVITARAPAGSTSRRIRVFPTTGPVFSGPHLPLLACSTQQLGLGAPTDDDCSAPTRTTWQYKNTAGAFVPLPDPATVSLGDVATTTVDGREVPYIVRTEQGVDQPLRLLDLRHRHRAARAAVRPERVERPPRVPLRRWLRHELRSGIGARPRRPPTGSSSNGYAVATATFNTFQMQCNDVLSAETTMMVKEHFAETYGPPSVHDRRRGRPVARSSSS